MTMTTFYAKKTAGRWRACLSSDPCAIKVAYAPHFEPGTFVRSPRAVLQSSLNAVRVVQAHEVRMKEGLA